jgi:hypothetical protein
MMSFNPCQEQSEKFIHLMKNETFHVNPPKMSGREPILAVAAAGKKRIFGRSTPNPCKVE